MTNNPQTLTDARGVPMSWCTEASRDAYEKACYQFQSYFGDPTQTLSRAVDADPEFVMGHVFNASATLLMSERAPIPAVRESIERAEALSHKATWREKALTAAARHWMEGRWRDASATWDRVLAEYPRDAFAIQCGHLTDFLVGDAVNLRDRIARVLPHWDEAVPGYSYILGMSAFGLEECNQYEQAEERARTALAIERRDGWSVHALTHVMEMQNRYDEGREFLQSTSADWAPDNGFAFHNWWHLALFHLESCDFDGAVRLYDEQVIPEPSTVSMQLLDGSALLWRLRLQDVDVTDRFGSLADMWAHKTADENGYYAFNDFHAVIALAGAGRVDEARDVLSAVKSAAQSNPALTRMMAHDVGIDACTAIIDFVEGRYGAVVDALLPIRSYASRFGGSHAQRDILTQTLFEAAARSGHYALAGNLVNERAAQRPNSPMTRRFRERATAG